ncbi:Uncharacterised protein [[Clostridium] sordellii]|nr:Uncharacterised protein [[Clostridium] sordellii] [Paeniclostridium sordellii]
MFISVILWGIVFTITVLGIYVLYNDRKNEKENKDDIY